MEAFGFKVFVTCMTYNQSVYIKDTMDGFCMQKTNFPFVCAIIDDASTDGEPAIVQNYLEDCFEISGGKYYNYDETDDYRRVFAQHKDNRNCFFLVVYLKYNHYRLKKTKAPYVKEWSSCAIYQALCEGDDYWVDPLKLQKQVDFMESHPSHSLCFCAHKEVFPSGEVRLCLRYSESVEKCSMRDIIIGGGGYMATNSMLYRSEMYIPYSTWAIDCPVGDLPMMLSLAAKGSVGYLNEVMCVYRRSTVGSWTQNKSTDFRKICKHYKAIIKMWKQFDEWTNRAYHEIIREKKRVNRHAFYRNVLNAIIKK